MISADWLKRFCGQGMDLDQPHVFTHPDTDEQFTYATDGHRMVIIRGVIEGCTPSQEPNIKRFLIDPCGVKVETAALQAFLGCGKPTTRPCGKCDQGVRTCNCPGCDQSPHDYKCACGGRQARLLNHGWLGIAPINRALLAEMMKDVSAETVLVQIKSPDGPIHVLADDRRMVVMPMRDDHHDFKTAPHFPIKAKQ